MSNLYHTFHKHQLPTIGNPDIRIRPVVGIHLLVLSLHHKLLPLDHTTKHNMHPAKITEEDATISHSK